MFGFSAVEGGTEVGTLSDALRDPSGLDLHACLGDLFGP